MIIFMPLVETGEKSCQCLKGLVAEVFNLKKLVEAGIDKTIIEHISLIINKSEDKQKLNPVTIFQSNNIGTLSDPLALANHDSLILGKQKWLL